MNCSFFSPHAFVLFVPSWFNCFRFGFCVTVAKGKGENADE